MSWLSTAFGGEARKAQANLTNQFQRAQDRANRANEERYLAINKGYADLFERMQNASAGIGASARADIASNYLRERSAADQSLTSRGLGNSSVRRSAMRGIAADESRAMLDLSDRLAQRQLGLYSVPLAGLGFQERRTDVGPDLASYVQLSQMAGSQASSPLSSILPLLGTAGGAIAGGMLGGPAGSSLAGPLGGALLGSSLGSSIGGAAIPFAQRFL